MTYRGHKEGRSRFVKNYESKAPTEMANNVISRVGCSVTQCFVSLNDQQYFIDWLGQSILLSQVSQIVKGSLKQAEHLILDSKGSAIIHSIFR